MNPNSNIRRHLIAIAALLILTATSGAQQQRALILLVNGPANGWIDSDLQDQLERLISEKNQFVMLPPMKTEILRAETKGRFDRETLIRRGLQINCRYVIWCNILTEELRIQRGLKIPFFASQKRVAAKLEYDVRIVDCFRGRTVFSKRMTSHKYGASSLQYFEENTSDPNLHMTYLERKDLFDGLERKAAGKIFAELERIAKQR